MSKFRYLLDDMPSMADMAPCPVLAGQLGDEASADVMDGPVYVTAFTRAANWLSAATDPLMNCVVPLTVRVRPSAFNTVVLTVSNPPPAGVNRSWATVASGRPAIRGVPELAAVSGTTPPSDLNTEPISPS